MTAVLNIANTEALDVFDSVTHMAFGDDNTTPIEGNMALGNELLRVSLESSTKDTGTNSYTFVGRIPLPQLNSSTIREVGLFTASSGGTMACRILSPVDVTKTSDDEILYTIELKVNTINN